MQVLGIDDVQKIIKAATNQECKILIGGPVNSGKSTLARKLVNHLLSHISNIAWLDCDMGQPEFTPPSVVSLHVLDKPITGLKI